MAKDDEKDGDSDATIASDGDDNLSLVLTEHRASEPESPVNIDEADWDDQRSSPKEHLSDVSAVVSD